MTRMPVWILIALLAGASALKAQPVKTDQLHRLDSTVFESVYYNDDREVLTLTFHNGAVYDYYQVSRKTYETFMRTPYKGSFFHAHIRNGYTWQRMDQRQVATLHHP